MISIALPVGPLPVHKQWLPECLDSLRRQTMPSDDIILLDDMAGLDGYPPEDCRLWRAPWLLGPAALWNIGVSLAKNDLVLLMGSDDWLEPTCLEEIWQEWERRRDPLGYYSLTVRYNDGRPEPLQDLPCNAAAVHKRLWRHTGGFAPEAAVGGMDAAFISVLLYHKSAAGNIWPVAKGTPLYNVRVHPGQDTAGRGVWQGVILQSRDILTRNWAEPRWGRYEP